MLVCLVCRLPGLCCRLGFIRFKKTELTLKPEDRCSVLCLFMQICACAHCCALFLVLFLLYSLFFLSMPQEMLSVSCSLVPWACFDRMCPASEHSHPKVLWQLQWFRDRFDLSAQFCSRESRGDLAIMEG